MYLLLSSANLKASGSIRSLNFLPVFLSIIGVERLLRGNEPPMKILFLPTLISALVAVRLLTSFSKILVYGQ